MLLAQGMQGGKSPVFVLDGTSTEVGQHDPAGGVMTGKFLGMLKSR